MCGHQGRRSADREERASRSPVTVAADERVTHLDRDRVIEQLRLQVGQGRLSLDEFGARVDETLEARTGGQLTVVLRGLPRIRTAEEVRRQRRATVLPYVFVSALLIAIWAATGFGFPWPVFPLVGWGLPVLSERARLSRPPQVAADTGSG